MTMGEQRNSTVKAKIEERHLKFVPHNTWTQIGQEAMISLNEDSRGNIQTSGSMKIIEFVMHELVALIVKLTYRVSFVDPYEGTSLRDFVIGHAIHMPYITKAGNLRDIES